MILKIEPTIVTHTFCIPKSRKFFVLFLSPSSHGTFIYTFLKKNKQREYIGNCVEPRKGRWCILQLEKTIKESIKLYDRASERNGKGNAKRGERRLLFGQKLKSYLPLHISARPVRISFFSPFGHRKSVQLKGFTKWCATSKSKHRIPVAAIYNTYNVKIGIFRKGKSSAFA